MGKKREESKEKPWMSVKERGKEKWNGTKKKNEKIIEKWKNEEVNKKK